MSRNKPLVSIVIISYNRCECLRRSVQAARDQTYANTEILIVDNDSADDGWQEVQKEYPEVRVIRMHRNMGWPTAKNIASANVRGEFIYYLDDDLYLFPDAVEKAIAILSDRPEIIIVSGQFMTSQPDRFKRMSVWKDKDITPPASMYTNAIYGGHAAFRAGVLRDIGYYPEHSMYGGLDSYIALRALDMGYLVYWSPEILGYHEGGVGGRPESHNFQQTMLNRIHLGWSMHPLDYALAGTFLPIFQFASEAARRGLTGAYLWALPKIPMAILRALLAGRKPVRRSTMKLRENIRQFRPSTIQELLRICPPNHPVRMVCERIITAPSKLTSL